MKRHEARVALARIVAKDALERFLDRHMSQYMSFGMANTCIEYIKYWLKPFFAQNDIEDVTVQEMKDIEHFYPRLYVTVIAKSQASYVNVDFKTTLGEDIYEN